MGSGSVPIGHIPTREVALGYGMAENTTIRHLRAAGVSPFCGVNELGQQSYWWPVVGAFRALTTRLRREKAKAVLYGRMNRRHNRTRGVAKLKEYLTSTQEAGWAP